MATVKNTGVNTFTAYSFFRNITLCGETGCVAYLKTNQIFSVLLMTNYSRGLSDHERHLTLAETSQVSVKYVFNYR